LLEIISKNNDNEENKSELADEFNMDLPKIKSSDISEAVYYIS
jgi:hypothetical protein